MNVLHREIVRNILGKLGLVPPPNFGKVGITTKDFKINKTLVLEFENKDGQDQHTEFALWSGNIVIAVPPESQTLRALATDVCDNDANYHELVVVYQLDSAPIHAVKHVFSDDNDEGLFLTKSEDKTWKPVSTYGKLIACAGFERMTQVGLAWKPCDNYDSLYSSLIEIVEM